MSEQIKKAEQIEQDADLSEQDLDEVAGGSAKEIEGVDILIRKKPSGTASTAS